MASRTRSRRSSAGGAAGLPGGSPRRTFGSRCEVAAAAAFASRSSLGQDQVSTAGGRGEEHLVTAGERRRRPSAGFLIKS
ncbi:hypothetical protein ZWY2020_032365 [Hordeum vulgare]|nr:hypothetical protein ZWY2020_032365 [Hordeum vulgare]